MSTTANYSIKDLEILTDIKSHTIRIWEKRYGILKPNRSDTNIRQYDNDDLTKLLNVSMLNKQGFKISKIAVMTDFEIRKLILDNISDSAETDIIDGLIVGMIELNEVQFNTMIEKSSGKIGFERTIIDVIFPFFYRIGVMWQAGAINPAQEHFITHLVREKLILSTAQLTLPSDPALPKVLLFLPDRELHELALLFYNYALRSRNYQTLYLSQAVPVQDIHRIIKIANPSAIICAMTNPVPEAEIKNIVEHLNAAASCEVLITGPVIKSYQGDLGDNISTFTTLEEMLNQLKINK